MDEGRNSSVASGSFFLNSRFASTGASTRSTPSARCSASLVMQRHRPMPNFIPATGCTLHLVAVWVNRIGKVAASAIVMDFRQKRVIIGISLLFVIYAILNELIGRGSPVQGLSGLPLVFVSIFCGNIWSLISTLLLNVCEGIFVIAEGLSVHPVYKPLYAWLSLSPLPSFLDGFSSINTQMETRLSIYVPMSWIVELISF